MSIDKVISAATSPCPSGKAGIVTTKVYESGKMEYFCTNGSKGFGSGDCNARLGIDCSDNHHNMYY